MAARCFFDEVGEMPAAQQARLLRFLDQGEVRRIGETRERTVDVRVVAATNRDLKAQVTRGHFREDLYFRLATATYRLPALRDRPEDVEPLTRHWLMHLGRDDGHVVTVSRAALDALRAHRWTGNVRELHSVLEHAWSLLAGQVMTDREVLAAQGSTVAKPLVGEVLGDKRRLAQRALATHRWNAKRAAESLGINRSTLYRWLGPGGRGDTS